MKPEKDRKGGRKLLELREKALCRGEKLANTLRKMVAKGGPGDVPGLSFLKELEQTLESMRQPSDQRNSPKPTPRKRRAESTSRDAGSERHPSSKPRSRRVKPLPAPTAAE